MVAVDTNVLVRLLTEDDPKQAAAAKLLFASEEILIPKTVLLEAAWVLRSLYGFEEREICDVFRKLLGLENVQAEDQTSVASALKLAAFGLEFADALHLSSSPAARFVSFDRALVRRARRAGVANVSEVAP